MTTRRSQWPSMPPHVVGGRRDAYLAVQELASEQAKAGRSEGNVAYFRKSDLAERVGLSPSQLTKVLRALADDDGLIEYLPGNPGRLSEVRTKGGK